MQTLTTNAIEASPLQLTRSNAIVAETVTSNVPIALEAQTIELTAEERQARTDQNVRNAFGLPDLP